MNQPKDRPYIICHVLCSIDGRIDGAFLLDPASGPSRSAYSRLQGEFAADAVAYGSVTAKGFAGFDMPKLAPDAVVPEGDCVAPHGESSYCVSLDPEGEVAWTSGAFQRPGREGMHVIEVLCEEVSAACKAHLREHGVSYIVAGSKAKGLDLALAMSKLKELFGIDRLLVCGGGVADMSFLSSGVIDELSLVIAPVASGESGVATVFDESSFAAGGGFPFVLASVERTEADGLHLVYRNM